MEEESDLNERIDKTNKSTSKSSLTKSNKQKQQRFQEETPDEGSNRQQYDDEVQKYDRPHPSNAPEWSYIVQQQNLIFNTDIDQGLITEYEEEEEEVSSGTTPATGNTT
ncbi:unnamed protein product [Rhizophagus irregularis]|nr:unnamed protein product [Rhizophagus irregularis]